MKIGLNDHLINTQSVNLQSSKIFEHLLTMMTPLELGKLTDLLKTIDNFAEINGAVFDIRNDSIILNKEINGKQWSILTINVKDKYIDTVVDIKQFHRKPVDTGLASIDMRSMGYDIRRTHEVRGQLAWLLDTDIKGKEIMTSQGKNVFVKMTLEELKLGNGDVVRYNTWDFKPYALYKTRLSENVISCESPEHKRTFILQLADDFCSGKTDLGNKLSLETKEKLHKIHETRKAPAYLSGYEIHHDGYGNMLLLSQDIHCRKLPHIGGSYLMNTRNYAIYIDNWKLDESVGKILSQELTADKISSYDNLSIEEKGYFISSIGNKILCNMGLSDVSIEFTELSKPTTCGLYCDAQKQIIINKSLLENLRYALRTELHEIRHAIQHDAIQHQEKYEFCTETLNKWADNIKYYIKPELDYESYILQPIELDAEFWASSMLNNIKPELYV